MKKWGVITGACVGQPCSARTGRHYQQAVVHGQQVARWSILAHPFLPAATLLMLLTVYKQDDHICPSSLPLSR
jgi:hypothetical protein